MYASAWLILSQIVAWFVRDKEQQQKNDKTKQVKQEKKREWKKQEQEQVKQGKKPFYVKQCKHTFTVHFPE